jgi:transcriptional regulator with XRE-family HTH domain
MAVNDPASQGDRLRRIREAQNCTLTDVARRAKISKAYLSQLERDGNKQPSYDVVIRLATALGVSVEELTGRPAVWDPSSADKYPPALRAFAEKSQLPQGDVEMLAHIHYRGRQPDDVEDWAHIYETIRRTIR